MFPVKTHAGGNIIRPKVDQLAQIEVFEATICTIASRTSEIDVRLIPPCIYCIFAKSEIKTFCDTHPFTLCFF